MTRATNTVVKDERGSVTTELVIVTPLLLLLLLLDRCLVLFLRGEPSRQERVQHLLVARRHRATVSAQIYAQHRRERIDWVGLVELALVLLREARYLG